MFSFNIIYAPQSFILKYTIISEIFKDIEACEGGALMGILNIVFVDKKEIQSLNNNHRQIDSSTDVLSFHYFDDFSELDTDEIAGEIILCEDKIISQGKEFKLGSELECYKLIIHSVFHIIGYDHVTDSDYNIMHNKEQYIWNKIFNS